MKHPALMRSLRDSCERLPAQKRALLRQLGHTAVSNDAFVTALVIVQMQDFESSRLLRVASVSEVTGMPVRTVRRAVEELLAVGALERRIEWRGQGRRIQYRLAASFVTGEPATGTQATRVAE